MQIIVYFLAFGGCLASASTSYNPQYYQQVRIPSIRRLYSSFGDLPTFQKHSFKRSLDFEQSNFNTNEVTDWNNEINVLKFLAGQTESITNPDHKLVKRSENMNTVNNPPRRQRQQSNEAYHYQPPQLQLMQPSSTSFKNIQPTHTDFSYLAPAHTSQSNHQTPSVIQSPYTQIQQHHQVHHQNVNLQSPIQPQINHLKVTTVQGLPVQHQGVQPAPQVHINHQTASQSQSNNHQHAAPALNQPQTPVQSHDSHAYHYNAPQHSTTHQQQVPTFSQPQINSQLHPTMTQPPIIQHQQLQTTQPQNNHQHFHTVPQQQTVHHQHALPALPAQHSQPAQHTQPAPQTQSAPPQSQSVQQHYLPAPPQTHMQSQAQPTNHQPIAQSYTNQHHNHGNSIIQNNPSNQQASEIIGGTKNIAQHTESHNHVNNVQPASQQGYTYENYQRTTNPFSNANTYANINVYQPKPLQNNNHEHIVDTKRLSLSEPPRDLKHESPQSTSANLIAPLQKENEYLPPTLSSPTPVVNMPQPVLSSFSTNTLSSSSQIAPENTGNSPVTTQRQAISTTTATAIAAAAASVAEPEPETVAISEPEQNLETNVKYLRIIQTIPGQPEQVTTLKIEQTISKTGHQTVQIYNMTPEEVAAIKDSDAASIDVSALRTTGTAPAQFYQQLAQPATETIAKPISISTSWTPSNNVNNFPTPPKPIAMPVTHQTYHEPATAVQQSYEPKPINQFNNHQTFQPLPIPSSPKPIQHAPHQSYGPVSQLFQSVVQSTQQHQLPSSVAPVQQSQTSTTHIQNTQNVHYPSVAEQPSNSLNPSHSVQMHHDSSSDLAHIQPQHQQHHHPHQQQQQQQEQHHQLVQSAPSVETVQILQETSRTTQSGYPLASELRPQIPATELNHESSSTINQDHHQAITPNTQPVVDNSEIVDNSNGYNYRPYGLRRY